jgi:hypothetical protein
MKKAKQHHETTKRCLVLLALQRGSDAAPFVPIMMIAPPK